MSNNTPPAKRRAKRKAADADIDADETSALASLDLSKSKTGPTARAAALLTLLPDNASRQHAMAQKLTKAFSLVISELENRSNKLARESESQGTRKPIAFRFPAHDEGKQGEERVSEEEAWSTIHLPEESFLNIMKFLTGRQIVKCASLTNKAWLSASRNPLLWDSLDNSCGLTNANKKLNMTALQNLLRRPQFASLKHLMMPRNALKLSAKSIKQLSKLCPCLESFSVGFATDITGPKMKGADLIEVAETFSNLNAIHTHMWSITSMDIVSVAKIMESRLLDLRVRGDTITGNYLSDSALGKIAKSCPNLQYFAYKISNSFYYKEELDGLSGKGILALVSICRRLEVLELENATRVGREVFEEILQMLALAKESNAVAKAVVSDDDETFALRKIILSGYPFVVTGNPLRIKEATVRNDSVTARIRSFW